MSQHRGRVKNGTARYGTRAAIGTDWTRQQNAGRIKQLKDSDSHTRVHFASCWIAHGLEVRHGGWNGVKTGLHALEPELRLGPIGHGNRMLAASSNRKTRSRIPGMCRSYLELSDCSWARGPSRWLEWRLLLLSRFNTFHHRDQGQCGCR